MYAGLKLQVCQVERGKHELADSKTLLESVRTELQAEIQVFRPYTLVEALIY